MTSPINTSAPRPFVQPAEVSRAGQERANPQPQSRSGLERDEGTSKPATQSTQETRLRNREAREARAREEQDDDRTRAFSREAPNADGAERRERPRPGQFLNIVI